MVNRSLVNILHLSIAHGHLHELAALMVLAFMVLWELSSSHSKFIELLLLFLCDDIVGTDLLLNFPEVGVLVHGLLCDWNHGVNNVPKDTLNKWSSGERALIGEPPVEIHKFDEFLQIKWAICWSSSSEHSHLSVLLLINKSGKELVVEENIWILRFP